MDTQKNVLKKSTNCFFTLSIIILIAFEIISCKGGETKVETDKDTSAQALVDQQKGNAQLGIQYLYCDTMTKALIDKYYNLPNGNQNIILKFRTNNLTEVNPVFDLLSYLATNHGHHGEGVSPDILQADMGCSIAIQAGSSYVFGNNYLRIRDLKSFINGRTEPNAIAYLKFTPELEDSHIRFRITAHKSNGDLIPGTLLSPGDDLTNPSPPAPPPN